VASAHYWVRSRTGATSVPSLLRATTDRSYYILATVCDSRNRKLRRGDVVRVKDPSSVDDGADLMKRLHGMAGDRILANAGQYGYRKESGREVRYAKYLPPFQKERCVSVRTPMLLSVHRLAVLYLTECTYPMDRTQLAGSLRCRRIDVVVLPPPCCRSGCKGTMLPTRRIHGILEWSLRI
jgi:hypothetical protein